MLSVRLVALPLVVLILPGSVPCAEAQCQFAARDRAIIEDGTQSTASVATIAPGGLTKLGRKVRFADDTEVVGDKVKLGNGASVDDLQSNHLHEGKATVVRGSATGAVLLGVDGFCPIVDFDCGGDDVSVGRGETRELPPGSYGTVVLDRGATLELGDGVYEVCEIDADKNVVIMAGAGTTLHVAERFGLANGSLFGLGAGGSAATVHVAGSVKLGRRVDVTMALSAPAAQVAVGNGSQFAGDVCAKSFKSGKRSELSCAD